MNTIQRDKLLNKTKSRQAHYARCCALSLYAGSILEAQRYAKLFRHYHELQHWAEVWLRDRADVWTFRP